MVLNDFLPSMSQPILFSLSSQQISSLEKFLNRATLQATEIPEFMGVLKALRAGIQKPELPVIKADGPPVPTGEKPSANPEPQS